MKNSMKTLLSVGMALGLAACGSRSASFSILADTNTFKQNSASVNGKIDILWVIDNSGSMRSSQESLAANMQRFMKEFNRNNYDYQMAVTTSDAYKVMFGANANMAKFKDGTNQTSHTGYFIIKPDTPDRDANFIINMMQGIYGSGDERVFSSMEQTLKSPLNAGFPRPDAFLSVIILSDEDDFSHDTSESRDGQYNYAGLHTVQRYVDYLDGLTGATAKNRSSKYNVNSITILDQVCLDSLNASNPGRRIGLRYVDISNATNGIIGSLCGDFGTTLSKISNKIIELSTQFYLDRVPRPETLRITINGLAVPMLTENSPEPWEGFLYHADTNSVTFHSEKYTPPAGALITVDFDPVTIK